MEADSTAVLGIQPGLGNQQVVQSCCHLDSRQADGGGGEEDSEDRPPHAVERRVEPFERGAQQLCELGLCLLRPPGRVEEQEEPHQP